MQEKGESLLGQDRDCRPCHPISSIPGDECVLLCLLLCLVLHYHPRTKPSTQEPWSLASNGGLQFGEGVAIACPIDSPLSEEINENDTLRVSEHCQQNLPRLVRHTVVKYAKKLAKIIKY
ncbi:hypothetical protein AVEN_52697-1 [Araneus ventricosus]|uniref:Uncharacterized protein n=1 Tax=Araneus ventricosus TaxID=182803 RepID=A0A4Y2ELZ7_ARAVE|nr:hypothetical protein AVEN_52697-1 [Araneus ventricosus]